MPAAATPPAPTTEPTRTGRVLGLVRALIDYGKQLASTLQQRTPPADLADIRFNFGIVDIGEILARIARGLLRAAALEARLAARPDHEPAASAARSAPSPREPRAGRPADQSADAPDTSPARLPTPDDIAAEVRHRTVGAVLADICRDLAIVTSHPLWPQLSLAIIENDGNLATLVMDIYKRVSTCLTNLPASELRAALAPYVRSAVVPGTGPP
jgi:hypothetical protein